MSTSDSLEALRRANPRAQEDFRELVDSAARAVRVELAAADAPVARSRDRHAPSRRFLGLSAAAGLVAVAAAVAFLTVASPGGGPGVEDASAAVRTAAAVTAGAAERSGTAVVHMTRDGETWAAATIRWNGDDIAVAQDAPRRSGKRGHPMLVVGGVLYGFEQGFGWVAFGDPGSIDPDSGTTPAETLAAVREDVGGATLRRILDGMTGLTVRELGDESTVYSGKVASRLIARETGVKDGQSLRVLPVRLRRQRRRVRSGRPARRRGHGGRERRRPPDRRGLGWGLCVDVLGDVQRPGRYGGPEGARRMRGH